MRYRSFILCSLLGLAALPSQAQLILNVDTANEEFFFTGSATGNVNYVSIGAFTTYNVDFGSPSFTPSESISLFSGLDFSASISTANLTVFDSSDFLLRLDSGIIIGSVPDPSPFTITANGTRFDYSGTSSNFKTVLEGSIGTSLPNTSGTGFGALEVVPEPTSAALVLSGLGLLAFRRRR